MTTLEKTRTDGDLPSLLSDVTALQESLTAAGGKFIFVQRLRDFVSVTGDVLQHKAFPFIEGVEEQMQKFHDERTSAVLERRAANNDEMMETPASIDEAMLVFTKSGSKKAMVAAAVLLRELN